MEIIGDRRINTQISTLYEEIHKILRSNVLDHIFLFSAFLTLKGAKKLVDIFEDVFRESTHHPASVYIIVGKKQFFTEPRAINYLLKQSAFGNLQSELELICPADENFHAKAYLFFGGESSFSIVGSSNLTGTGFSSKGEVSIKFSDYSFSWNLLQHLEYYIHHSVDWRDYIDEYSEQYEKRKFKGREIYEELDKERLENTLEIRRFAKENPTLLPKFNISVDVSHVTQSSDRVPTNSSRGSLGKSALTRNNSMLSNATYTYRSSPSLPIQSRTTSDKSQFGRHNYSHSMNNSINSHALTYIKELVQKRKAAKSLGKLNTTDPHVQEEVDAYIREYVGNENIAAQVIFSEYTKQQVEIDYPLGSICDMHWDGSENWCINSKRAIATVHSIHVLKTKVLLLFSKKDLLIYAVDSNSISLAKKFNVYCEDQPNEEDLEKFIQAIKVSK